MVQRVRHFRDETPCGAARQLRVGIEDDDIADAGGHRRRTAADRNERRVGGATQQSIELVQLAALAFPPDPLALPLVPEPAAMQQQEPIAVRRRSVAQVQAGDAIGGGLEQLVVARSTLVGTVGPVGQQREAEIVVGIGQMMYFEPLDLQRDRSAAMSKASAWRSRCAEKTARRRPARGSAGSSRQSDWWRRNSPAPWPYPMPGSGRAAPARRWPRCRPVPCPSSTTAWRRWR